MATYNGSLFIKQQLDSIISELSLLDEDFEIVIVDDCSGDNTVDIIKSYNLRNFKVIINDKNLGHVKSFERSLANSTGEFIFLSDQDDIWVPGRVKLMTDALCKNNKGILFSGFSCVDESNNVVNKEITPPLRGGFGSVFKLFIGKANFWGCTALIRRSSLCNILPFYKITEAHDHWIALVGISTNQICAIGDITLQHRIHHNNITAAKKRPLRFIIKTRYIMLLSIFNVVKRYIFNI